MLSLSEPNFTSMYLKKLEIHGFKSFANQTVLDFLPPKNGHFSITAVVGPNGSGKSNVTDAIRWVMGETSMKTIRSKKSEDVIFNGSEAKGALSAAEVTMVLDNKDDKIGVGTEEIQITRRLYRSGESEFLVNNNPTKLLDIHLLLAKAQFAEHSYSIVSQGMIDRLLTVTPSERKDFFDEASGIKEFQIKRHQADLKLERTQENIQQADVLLKEVEPRLKLLARQVKKLEERHEVESKLLNAQESYYFTLYARNKKEVDSVLVELEGIEGQYRNLFKKLESLQQELATLARSSTRQEVFDALQNRHQEAVRLQNSLERTLSILEGQLHTQYSQAGKQNINWLEQKVHELKNTQQTIAQQLDQHTEDEKNFEHKISEQRNHLNQLQVSRTELTVKISRLQNQLLHGQSEQHYLQLSGLTAVKAVVEAKNKFGKVYGLVAELGEVEPAYQLALEVAAGQHLSSIVVEDESVARLAIEYLREHKYGVATFLPLQKIQPRHLYKEEEGYRDHPEVIDIALNLIKFDEKFRNIFSFIFGSTFIVEDLKSAERLGVGKLRIVTLAGDVVERNSVMRGGFRQRKASLGFSSKISLASNNRLEEYQTELAAEQQKIVELEKNIETSQRELLTLQVEHEALHTRKGVVTEQLKTIEKEIAALEQELTLINSSPEQYGEHLKKLSADKEQLNNQILQAQQEVARIALEVENFNKKEEEKKQRVFLLQEHMQTKQVEVNTGARSTMDIRGTFISFKTS
jgi:chromosome segregation protein